MSEEFPNNLEHTKFKKLCEELDGFWALNWEEILNSMQILNLTMSLKAELVKLMVGYIQRVFTNGNFENLKGAESVLRFLKIDNIEFSADYKNKIFQLYDKYSLSFFYSMSPPLYDGKLSNGEQYDKIQYVRQLLQKAGALQDELTDKYIQELWDLREVLIRMHHNLKGRSVKSLTDAERKFTWLVKILN